MTNWFESITKTLADDKLSRRQMMTKVAGFTAAAALAALIPADEAFAAISDRGHQCKYTSCCTCVDSPNCELKKYGNYNCYCFQKLGSTSGVCACNSYCSSITSCTNQANCPTGFACVTNTACGCTQGFCIQKCNSTCTLGSNGAGRTAA